MTRSARPPHNRRPRSAGGIAVAVVLASLAALTGCQSIPQGRYGIDALRFEGVNNVDEAALRSCLATTERGRFALNFGNTYAPTCGAPPFDAGRLRIPLWRWPWEEWPLLDRNVFERDLQRIERWYRARGYYDAEVVETRVAPEQASDDDRVPEGEALCGNDADEGCGVAIEVQIREGEPVRVTELELSGTGPNGRRLSGALRQTLAESMQLEIGERFDEALYDRSKAAIQAALYEESFGCAEVEGHVLLNPETREAKVSFEVHTGGRLDIGSVRVVGNDDLAEHVIRSVAQLRPEQPFVQSELAEAQHQIYALGTFSSVEVVGTPRRNDAEQCTGYVDVVLRVTPGRRLRYGVGGGVELGSTQVAGVQTEEPQGNLHALAFIEHRNFLGGLRRARFEIRPKLLFTLPGFNNPSFGGDVRFDFRQPAFIESRTTGVISLRNDYGPDPSVTDSLLFRNLFDVAPGLRRSAFDGKLSFGLGVHLNLYRSAPSTPEERRRDYRVLFFEQTAVLDLRDDSREPRKGIYASIELHEALGLSWDYIRVVPDIRAYLPLGPLVLAGRFRLGIMHILGDPRDDRLDPASRALGPSPFRLRSGGASSHRGFVAGFLGDDDPSGVFQENSGGLRRWELSVELRAPLTEDIGLVAFADMGDVNREPSFRFDHLRLAVGGGLRYRTPVGNIRLDLGILVPGAQVLNACSGGATTGCNRIPTPPSNHEIGFLGLPGAVHVSIGEAF